MKRLLIPALCFSALFATSRLNAATPDSVAPPPSYADLADLADGTPLVIRAQVRKQAQVEAVRAPGLKPGFARLYIEAQTQALIAGSTPVGGAFAYLVDVPLDARGKVPKLKKQSVVLFARAVPGKPGELQLVAPDAQIAWTPELDTRLKGLLGELLAPGAPPRIKGLREALHSAGALAGAGDTQLFLATSDGNPAAITVTRHPGEPPRWQVSFSELVAAGEPPRRDTLAWYRLACFLPRSVPLSVQDSQDPADVAAVNADYAFVLEQLGPCGRTRQ